MGEQELLNSLVGLKNDAIALNQKMDSVLAAIVALKAAIQTPAAAQLPQEISDAVNELASNLQSLNQKMDQGLV